MKGTGNGALFCPFKLIFCRFEPCVLTFVAKNLHNLDEKVCEFFNSDE